MKRLYAPVHTHVFHFQSGKLANLIEAILVLLYNAKIISL